MIEKVFCDGCTDKGHCPEYKAGAACVNDRERIIKYKIRDNEYLRSDMVAQGWDPELIEEAMALLDEVNLDYTLYGRPGCYPDRYELATPEGEKLNVNLRRRETAAVVIGRLTGCLVFRLNMIPWLSV